MPKIWNDERITLIKERWAEGLSATQIAQELGNGISRNAVIGKIHRMGLSGPNTIGPNRVTKFRSTLPRQPRHDGAVTTAKPFIPRIVEMPAPEAISPWDEFSEHGCCKYIDQHPAIQSWRCCGQPVKTEPKKLFSYC